jgi:integrase/recombinase XerD
VDLVNRDLSQSTRARRLSAIKQFFHFCLEENWRADHPALQITGPGRGKSLPKTMTVIDVDRLMDCAITTAKGAVERARNACLMQVLYATGMRVSELMSLPVAACRGEPEFLLIKGKGGKERIVPLSPPASAALNLWLYHRDQEEERKVNEGHDASPFLFPSRGKLGHLTRHWFYQNIKNWAVHAGIDASVVTPHTIRHAFATHLLANGADLRVIQTLLGHADVSTTEIYTHVLDDHLRDLVMDHHPLSTKRRKSIGNTSSEGQ